MGLAADGWRAMTDRPGIEPAVDLDAPLWPDGSENLPAVTQRYPAGLEGSALEPAQKPHPLPAGPYTGPTAARVSPAPRAGRRLRPEDYFAAPDDPLPKASLREQAVTAARAGRAGGPGRDWIARQSGDSGGRKKTIIAGAAVIAVVAAGGAVLGLETHRHHASLSGAAQRSSSGPQPHGSAAPPSHGPTAPPSSSTRPQNPLVRVGPGVPRDLAAIQVVGLLISYFTAINSHDYAAYQALLDPQMRQQMTGRRFASGYRTTTDSGPTLTGIATAPDGRTAANVRFTSHQKPSDSPDRSSCTNWSITLFLERSGGGYLIGPAAAGYQASHQPC